MTLSCCDWRTCSAPHHSYRFRGGSNIMGVSFYQTSYSQECAMASLLVGFFLWPSTACVFSGLCRGLYGMTSRLHAAGARCLCGLVFWISGSGPSVPLPLASVSGPFSRRSEYSCRRLATRWWPCLSAISSALKPFWKWPLAHVIYIYISYAEDNIIIICIM